MYAIELSEGEFLRLNGEVLWFNYKQTARCLSFDLDGKIWERQDFDYCI